MIRTTLRKRIKATVALALAGVMLFTGVGCGKNGQTTQQTDTQTTATAAWKENPVDTIATDDNYRTYYEVFVYSFCDSNGDGIGDLNGVRSKLDYIQNLGFTGIWLMPIMPSPTYHKYDTTDYKAIDSDYGTIDDFKALLEDCHKRNIKVIIDLAMNHSSSKHPWFTQACQYMKSLPAGQEPNAADCKYVNYYNFSKSGVGGYAKLNGTDWYYEAQFWSEMPDLNWDNEAVREEFKEIAKYWMDLGIDGFRLDAVIYYYKDDHEKCHEVLKWFNDYVTSLNPDSYIVCEAWTNQQTMAAYYETGVDSMFDFAFADQKGVIAQSVKGITSAKTYVTAQEAEQKLYSGYNVNYINAPFYSNHDMARSAGYYPGDLGEAQTKMGQALNILMSGNVFVYYGEELGMKGSGKDENKRAPMYWSKEKGAEGMCKGPSGMEAFEMKYDSLEKQEKDACSIYSFVKDALLLRNQQTAIRKGTVENVESLSNDQVCVMKKVYDSQEVLLVINLGKEGQTVDLSGVTINGKDAKEAETVGELETSTDAVKRDGTKLSLPSYSVYVLK